MRDIKFNKWENKYRRDEKKNKIILYNGRE